MKNTEIAEKVIEELGKKGYVLNYEKVLESIDLSRADESEEVDINDYITGFETVEEEKEYNKTNTYFVDFGTGSGNEYASTLKEAKEIAEEGTSYTQESVKIYSIDKDDNYDLVAKLPWWGVQPDVDDIVTVSFGDYGFYGEWQ